MNTSATITKISAAFVKAQSEMSNAKKDATNPFFKSKYADLNSVREACLPTLNRVGISVIQPTTVVEGVNYVETILLHESGEYISSLTQIIASKANDAQSHGSGLSYARRYALQSICNIGADDDDGNKAVAPPKATTGELKAAIAQVKLATTVDQLKEVKATLPSYIVTDASFIAAGKEQYNLLLIEPVNI
jgi:hypothetical protein